MTRTLSGKVALVTGAGRGIGRAAALKLAGAGARILVNDLDPEPALETVAAIRAAGGEAIACAGDIAELQFAEQLVATALDAFTTIDIIVNNAGYTWDAVVQNMSDEQFQAMLDVHLVGPFRVIRAASRAIRGFAKAEADAGREVFRKIVNVSSIAGVYGNAGQVNYAAAKAGIGGLTRALAKEWGRYRVNVNCVAFGIIDTRLARAKGEDACVEVDGRPVPVGIPSQLRDQVIGTIPLGRAGTVEEAAGAIYLLCLPESNYISGQTLTCAGGL